MKDFEKNLYSFEMENNDMWHIKLCADMVSRDDYMTLDYFAQMIDEPFEVYEKHLRTIKEERTFHSIIVVDTPEEERIRMGDIDKIFIGEYDDEMKEKVEDYIKEKGMTYSSRHENEGGWGFSYVTRLCNWYPTLGFYFRREGLLRGGLTDEFRKKIEYPDLSGKEQTFRIMAEHLDTEYVKYVFGTAAAKKLKENYEMNFLDTFEYGTSCYYYL